ncbi:MAG: pitrilysin family protein [Planctomycetaceae bacterium]|nr:insulinase family protein [Planctomycetaceae bacterium]
MEEQFHIEHLPNGVTLLGQSMKDVSSAAVTFAVPAGAAYDPAPSAGAAAVISEWVMRGAGDRDTRALNDALDNLGCQHDASVVGEFVQLSSAQLGRNFAQAMEIFADILLRPRLEAATFTPSRSLVLQDLQSLDDEPARKAVMMLREKFYPAPLGRSIYGTVESLESLDAAGLEAYARGALGPRGTIVAVAGNIDWAAFVDQAGRLLGDWQAPGPPAPTVTAPAAGVTHIQRDSAQMHITLGHKACPASDKRFYAAHLAETVLSGGMSSRLFTHVREERGLAYHVSTHYHSLKGHAGMFTYAGTVPEKGQETLDVTVRELKRMVEGVTDDEMHRAKTQYKSATVMAGESTSARAFALAGDWYHLGRLRSLDEIIAAIDAVTADDVLSYVREFPAEDFTVMTIGPKPLDTSAL